MAPANRSGDAMEEGRRALAEYDWAAARVAFKRAADAGGGPEALEGLADAVFCLNDPEAAIAAHEAAYTGYGDAGRPVDAARVAIALAWEYRAYRGEPAVSDGWLGRARHLLDGTRATREWGWLALREASFAMPEDPARALERSAEAAAHGRSLGDIDLEQTAGALSGLALVSQGHIAEGMARLDEATAAATTGEMRDPVAIGFSCCYLIFACERVRDLDRAGQWCRRLDEMAGDRNVLALRAVCRCHYGTVLMLRGEWRRAEAELTAAASVLAVSPREGADAFARLGELRRRQGRAEDAEAMLLRAEHHPLAILCKGALALERGDTRAAAEAAQRYLRMLGGAVTERAPALELLAEAQASAGRAQEAFDAAGRLAEIAESAGTDPLLGAARYAEGCAAAAAGGFGPAREAFEDAADLLGRSGLPFESARARVMLGAALRGLGRRDEARTELDRAREQFVQLGAVGELRRAGEESSVRRAGGTELSPRERQVLELIAQGRTNPEIAAALVISEHTVHRHVSNILAKLGAPSRAAAVATANARDLL